MNFDQAALQAAFSKYAVPFFWKFLAAIAAWIVGHFIIKLIGAGIGRAMTARKVDETLQRYLVNIMVVVLKILLAIAILGIFGIETTSFAAILAAAGVAIGMAWSGLLSNFAAGVFLMILRPFKVGDMIGAGGVTGVVKELGLFATTVDTADNLRTVIGNNKIFSDNIVNYSHNAFRRVDLTALVANGGDVPAAIARLKQAVSEVANVQKDPAVDVSILEYTPLGTVLAVRPHCANDHYWQVYFDTNKTIGEVAKSQNWPVPEQRMLTRSAA